MDILPTGKLNSDYLGELIGKIEIGDKDIVVGPGIGEDAAVIKIDDRYIIVKSDPITFATDRIGWYVVNVNANDIAAMGGRPKWFLVTMLLPEGKTTKSMIENIMEDLKKSCKELDISLIGGHTEVTPNLNHPILAGTMIGETDANRLIKTDSIKEGDLLFMTKGIAIEATSVIAREKKDEIIKHFGNDFYLKCINFLEDPGISVVKDARLAIDSVKVTGMHDPTEGGVLNGAYEMAKGAGLGLEIYLDKIPVYEETKILCEYYKISPYGAIASGSLLIAVDKNEGDKIKNIFNNNKVNSHWVPSISLIGMFTKKGETICVVKNRKKEEISPTGRDEVTKIL